MYPLPYLDFIALANEGRYRDALLRLEEAWFEDRSEFYAGLLQLMVALNQMEMGMQPTRTLRRARERLAAYAPQHMGLDVAELLRFIQQCEAHCQGNADAPHLTLALL
jgi:hypothetical protein